jgi:hypothetical protein
MAGFDYRALIGDAEFDYVPQPETQQLSPVLERLARSRMQVGPITTAPTGEEWIDALINRPQVQPPQPPAAQGGGITDEQLLAASVPEQEVIGSPAEQAAASRAVPGMEWVSELVPDEEPTPAPAAEPSAVAQAPARAAPQRPQSRQEMLLASLARPTREEGVKAGLFDGLFGGSKYSDDLKARRNAFDAYMANAVMGDASSADHAAQAEMQREQFLRQDETQRRGQNLTAGERAEDRAARIEMARANDLRARELAAEREKGATERTRLNKGMGGGGGGGGNPEREAKILDGEASYLAGRVSALGRGDVSMETVKKVLQGQPLEPGEELTPEQAEGIKRGKAALDLVHAIDAKKYAEQIKGGETREAGIEDKVGTTLYLKEWDPGKRMEVMKEITVRNEAVNRAVAAWRGLTDAERANIVKLGPGTVSDASLSPKAQAAAAAIQNLANFDIKAQAGSAVTDSEWGRQARAIGLPDGVSIFKAPQVMEEWLRGHDRIRKQMIRNANTAYQGLFTGKKKGQE